MNGISIKGQRRTFDGDCQAIKLGNFEQVFRIRWAHFALTFSFTGKQLRNNEIEGIAEKLESLDIKTLTTYMRESTTHVVARKRNTSKGLQALINGKFIVDDSFVDAIVEAAAKDAEGNSKLEADFDASWPGEKEHLPPQGAEQTQRPSSAYAPDTSRQEIFEGYTYIFYDEAQFDNLLAPITNGRGKALLRKAEPNSTTLVDFVRYVKSAAGERGLGEFDDGSEGKGVVVVKYQPMKGDTLPWYENFARVVALALGQRLVEQSEFLDAILHNDASVLRRPLEDDPTSTATPTSSAIPPTQNDTLTRSSPVQPSGIDPDETIAAPESPQPVRRGRTRRNITSRFKGFDSDDDKHEDADTPKTNIAVAPKSQGGLFVSQDPNSVPAESQTFTARRKRAREEVPDDDAEMDDSAILNEIAPAATKLKRRRLEEKGSARREGRPWAPVPVRERTPEPIVPKKKKPVKEIDIVEETRKLREEEDRRAKAEQEKLVEAMESLDTAEVRKLIHEEIMPVRSAPPRIRPTFEQESNRWDEKWEGRKNFKKFRRKGATDSRQSFHRVIVPLQVAKKSDFGIGDEYWLGSQAPAETESQFKAREAAEEAAAEDSFMYDQSPRQTRDSRRRTPAPRKNAVQEIVEIQDDSDEDLPPVVSQARRTATRAASRKVEKSSLPPRPSSGSVMSQAGLGLSSAPNRTQKRQATESLPSGKAKKAKQSLLVPILDQHEEDSDDEGLGFKFKKKR